MYEFDNFSMGARRFGAVNWLGLRALIGREVQRFWAVWTQTILAPLVTAGLFMLIFSIAIGTRRGEVLGVPFAHFIAPGIMMMTIIQNAFANTSSSIVISKVQGNIVDTLMPPLSAGELIIGYLAGGIARGVVVAIAIAIGLQLTLGISIAHPLWALGFAFLGAMFLAGLGIVAGIYANKFDQMAAITNFIVTPLAFLSGTFYSVHDLPSALSGVAYFNPVFYLIDGMRFAVLGVSDSSPYFGAMICLGASMAIAALGWVFFKTGYRLKN